MEQQKELRKRKKAQRSLDRMLDTIAPYMPKPTTTPEEAPKKWRLADGATKVEHSDHEEPVGSRR